MVEVRSGCCIRRAASVGLRSGTVDGEDLPYNLGSVEKGSGPDVG